MARLIWNGGTGDDTTDNTLYIDESTGSAYGSAIATGDTIIFNYRSGDFDTKTSGSDWNGIDLAGVEVGSDYGGSIVDWEVDVSDSGAGLVRVSGGQYIRLLGHSAGMDAVRVDQMARGGVVHLAGTIAFPSVRVGVGGRCVVATGTPVTASVNTGGMLTYMPDDANVSHTSEGGTTIINARTGTNTLVLKAGTVTSRRGTPWSSITQDGGHFADQSAAVIAAYHANGGSYSPEGCEGNVATKITVLNEVVGKWRGLLKAGNIVITAGTHNRL